MVRRTLLIAWMMTGATAWAQAPPTPSATYVPGTARTGVAVTCPASSLSPARVIPANTPIPDSLIHASEAQQYAYFCGSGAQPGTGSIGNPVGDVLNLGANMWIEQHIENPYSAQFATSFTHGFLTGLFSGSTPEAERQRQLALANLQQQQQLAAEQARQIEQAKIDGMFARLDAELKLSGTDAPLELKLEGGAPPLTMKLGDDSSGCSGGGIAGLPGIYLQDCSSDSAAQLARRAVALEGPEREVAEDAALQAAAKVPVLAAPSTDPFVADYQQQAQAYAAAAQQHQSALQQASEASGHSQADQSAVAYAQGQVAAAGDAVAAQQSLQQMIAISQTDEEDAVAARQAFEQSDVQLTVARERAADSLAGLAPSVVQVGAAPLADPTLSQPVSVVPAVRTVLPHAMAAAPPMSRATAPNTAAPAPAPTHESTQACLGAVGPTIGASVSLDNLNKELDHDMTAYNRLEQAEESQRERRAEWMGEMHEAAQDAAWGLIDKGAEGVLKSSKDELEASNKVLQQEMQPVQQEIAAFRQEVVATPAGAAADPAQIASYRNRAQQYREQARALIERREQIEDGLAQVEVGETVINRFTQARDFAISVARGDSDEEMLKDSMKKSALAVADLTPAGEAIGFGSLAVDVGYDLAVGFIGYHQLRQINENGAKFDAARRMLTARIARTTATLACYQAAQ
ncbi:MAG TPA: hypothetical protein VMD99_12970 [Terriglobales bacterium]|nr:hypothetical protein [Terriglobales bacterium]